MVFYVYRDKKRYQNKNMSNSNVSIPKKLYAFLFRICPKFSKDGKPQDVCREYISILPHLQTSWGFEELVD